MKFGQDVARRSTVETKVDFSSDLPCSKGGGQRRRSGRRAGQFVGAQPAGYAESARRGGRRRDANAGASPFGGCRRRIGHAAPQPQARQEQGHAGCRRQRQDQRGGRTPEGHQGLFFWFTITMKGKPFPNLKNFGKAQARGVSKKGVTVHLRVNQLRRFRVRCNLLKLLRGAGVYFWLWWRIVAYRRKSSELSAKNAVDRG